LGALVKKHIIVNNAVFVNFAYENSEKTSQPFFKIDVSDYAAGFYVLKLKKNQFSEPIVSKIIIQ